MRECRPKPHIRCGIRLSPHAVCEIPHTPDLLSDPHILVFGEPHYAAGTGVDNGVGDGVGDDLPWPTAASNMR